MAATGLSAHCLSTAAHYANANPPSFNNSKPRYRLHCSVPSKTAPNSSLPKRATASLSSPPEPKPSASSSSEPKPSKSVPGDGLKLNELGVEILSIALPAALALAADPITSLVDTAFVGHIGSVELAAVGVSASIFNLVSKLFNVPLLNITTSFVAEEQVKDSRSINGLVASEHQSKKFLPSVSTSLALAAFLGVAETIALSVGSGFFMSLMGISVDSPMRIPAEQFLTLRAFGAPAIVIALAAQGTFRGFKDTKTPLYAIGAGNLLNAVLDPILIFFFGFGISGAAVATVISEYLIALILMWKLNDEVSLISPTIEGGRVVRYLKSGGLLIGRTLAVIGTMTLATSIAAREGPTKMAGYQICTEVWLAVSLLTDALAIAGQALLARSYSQGNHNQAREVVNVVLKIGLATGVSLAVVLFLGFGAFSRLFTGEVEVLEIAWSGILFVAGSQPINAVAFVIDGLYYGVSDFGYAASSMVLVGLVSSVFLAVVGPRFGLAGVWTGLFLLMMLRVLAGVWRLGTKGGPWKVILSAAEDDKICDQLR